MHVNGLGYGQCSDRGKCAMQHLAAVIEDVDAPHAQPLMVLHPLRGSTLISLGAQS